MRKLFKRNQNGMSLLEILIVLGIIGFILSFLLQRIQGAGEKASRHETKLIISNLVEKINLYYADCGKYPASLDNLTTADTSCSNWGPDPYIKKIPKDKWNNDLTYTVSNGDFVIKSTGGKSGKEITSADDDK